LGASSLPSISTKLIAVEELVKVIAEILSFSRDPNSFHVFFRPDCLIRFRHVHRRPALRNSSGRMSRASLARGIRIFFPPKLSFLNPSNIASAGTLGDEIDRIRSASRDWRFGGRWRRSSGLSSPHVAAEFKKPCQEKPHPVRAGEYDPIILAQPADAMIDVSPAVGGQDRDGREFTALPPCSRISPKDRWPAPAPGSPGWSSEQGQASNQFSFRLSPTTSPTTIITGGLIFFAATSRRCRRASPRQSPVRERAHRTSATGVSGSGLFGSTPRRSSEGSHPHEKDERPDSRGDLLPIDARLLLHGVLVAGDEGDRRGEVPVGEGMRRMPARRWPR